MIKAKAINKKPLLISSLDGQQQTLLTTFAEKKTGLSSSHCHLNLPESNEKKKLLHLQIVKKIHHTIY